MNNDKQSPGIRMRRAGFLMGLFTFFGLMNSNCKKGELPADYQIKYEVNSTAVFYGGLLYVKINNASNDTTTFVINPRERWETVIGPVKKGFNAMLEVSDDGSLEKHLRMYTQISVSKNSSDYQIKSIDTSATPRHSVEISYKVDY